MAKSVNKVTLLGNLGKDPEMKSTPSGFNVARFSIATTDRVKDKDGNWQDRTEWHNVVAFQRTAEIASQYLKKGSKVYIEGRLHNDSWDDKETGQKKYKTEIIVNDLVLIGGGQREGGAEGGGGGYSSNRSGGAKSNNYDQRTPEHDESQAPAPAGEITDEDIPF